MILSYPLYRSLTESTDNPYEFAIERNPLILTQKILDHIPLFVIKRHALLKDSL